MTELLDIIKGRKSVRSFDGRELSQEDRAKLEQYAQDLANPFGIPVQLVFMNAKENGLSSPVLAGETLYVAGLVEKKPYADVAFGYSFERFVLYAWSLGIGTTWIGGTMKRELFEKAAGLKEGQRMPCMSPLGYPAKKRSLKEVMMRKGVGADARIPVDQFIFNGSFDTPITEEQRKTLGNILEMIQWAPSAVNKQPWRIICQDGTYHFYEKKSPGYVNDSVGDMQKIDIGIALCHFVMGLEEQGKQAQVSIADPVILTPDNTEYICSVTVTQK